MSGEFLLSSSTDAAEMLVGKALNCLTKKTVNNWGLELNQLPKQKTGKQTRLQDIGDTTNPLHIFLFEVFILVFPPQ